MFALSGSKKELCGYVQIVRECGLGLSGFDCRVEGLENVIELHDLSPKPDSQLGFG